MAKSAINKLLTEILYGIEKLIYVRFIDKADEHKTQHFTKIDQEKCNIEQISFGTP